MKKNISDLETVELRGVKYPIATFYSAKLDQAFIVSNDALSKVINDALDNNDYTFDIIQMDDFIGYFVPENVLVKSSRSIKKFIKENIDDQV